MTGKRKCEKLRFPLINKVERNGKKDQSKVPMSVKIKHFSLTNFSQFKDHFDTISVVKTLWKMLPTEYREVDCVIMKVCCVLPRQQNGRHFCGCLYLWIKLQALWCGNQDGPGEGSRGLLHWRHDRGKRDTTDS